MGESSWSLPLSKDYFCYQFGGISFSLVVRHLNFAYVLTIQIYYFALFSCYYTALIKTVNGNIVFHKMKYQSLSTLLLVLVIGVPFILFPT